MQKIVLLSLLATLSACGAANQNTSAVKTVSGNEITISGQDADTLFSMMTAAELVQDKSMTNVSTSYSAASIDCSFSISSGSRICSFKQTGLKFKYLDRNNAQKVIGVLANAGVPRLFQFEGGRYQVTNVNCRKSNLDLVTECLFQPTLQ